MHVIDYFLKYVKVDTQSNEESNETPSTLKQKDLSHILLKDLKEMGIENCYEDEFGQVYAFLPGEGETIGFNAHIDTATEISGANVKPRVISLYDGADIKLNEEYTTKVEDFPILKNFVGKTLVVTDGNTLLGADDKAGISIIMSMLQYYCSHKEIKHHPISVLFTCDEEVGRGSEHFDNKIFKADYAFTVDGASPYHASYENFNAAHAVINVKGVSIHPGDAKGKMVNASNVLMTFDSLLPKHHLPSDTSDYEGFHHLIGIEGSVDNANAYYILRDHDINKLRDIEKSFEKAKKELEVIYPKAVISLEIGEDYRNMKECFDKDKRALDKLESAYKKLGISLTYEPIRGGTDGATFSFKGCPTPNLGTGSYNHHGRFEFFVKEEAELMVEIIKEIVRL